MVALGAVDQEIVTETRKVLNDHPQWEVIEMPIKLEEVLVNVTIINEM